MGKQLTTTKFSALSEIVHKEISDYILEKYDSFLYIGMILYNDTYNTFCTILDIYKIKDDIYIDYLLDNAHGEIRKEKQKSLKEFYSYNNSSAIGTSKEEFNSDVQELIKGEISLNGLVEKHFGSNNSSSTELMTTNKNIVIDKRNELILKREFVASRYKSMGIILDAKKRELCEFVGEMKHQIEKVNKLIIQLELYLGVQETIEQIQIGLSASEELPISLRQRILYMDVECGDPSDGGLDFSNIEKFDEWLLAANSYWKKKNYEILIPEQKCIAVFRVRRDKKDYNLSRNPFINSIMSASANEGNMNTYIFIRNGENIYKIWSELLNIHGRLFPQKSELAELLKDLNKDDGWHKKDAENKLHDYKLHFLLLQGIFERTQIFQNSHEISLFNSSIDNSDKVVYIYDDDNTTQLPSGMPTFNNWKKKLNESIEEGSRIYFINSIFNAYAGYGDDLKKVVRNHIFKQWFVNDYSSPDFAPSSNVYTVFLETDHKFVSAPTLYIKYKSVKRWSNKESKKGYSFEIERDNQWIINYDAIGHKELKTLEFYMYTRIGREEYLSYIPLLMEIYKSRKAELELEMQFVKLVLTVNKMGDTEENNALIFEKIEWWKLKNKWKRSIDVDNTKALRMISKELKNNHDKKTN